MNKNTVLPITLTTEPFASEPAIATAINSSQTHSHTDWLDSANLPCYLQVSISQQTLTVYQYGKLRQRYQVSTAKNGIGSREGSGCTPLGRHVIAQKIGADAAYNTVFVGRVPTGEIYSAALAQAYPQRDWILTRIMWLAGCEEGVNKGCNTEGVCDTFQRYIYIHGTPDNEPMDSPLSHGCVRMRNADIIKLFDMVAEGSMVDILL